jgi:hypothetical protein
MTRALLSLIAVLAPALAPWLRSLTGATRRKAAWVMIGLGVVLILGRQVAAGGTLLTLGITLVAPGAVLGTGRRKPGGGSTVRTALLEMRLDHDSGAMDGRVLDGPFRGRSLASMTRSELLRLAAGIDAADAQSLRLLRAYLDRSHPGWDRETAAPPPPSPGGGPMTRDDALRILGLEPGADAEAVRAAHRRLVKRVHPDLGGSAALAAQINAAKDLLVGRPPDGAAP